MTIAVAYWCLFVAALLPYIWVGIAKAGARYDNRDPRAWLAKQDSPRRQRANAAQLNAFEAFPAFAAGVILAAITGVDPSSIALTSLIFVTARILHGLFYISDKATLRSLAWLVGIVCSFSLIARAALRPVT